MKREPITRRTMLKSASAVLALPTLEIMASAADNAAAAHGAERVSHLGVSVVDLFVPAFRIEGIEDELRHAAAHVRQARSGRCPTDTTEG